MTYPDRSIRRYQDVDLRIDPSLIGHAIAYANQYQGDWDVMVAAKALVVATGNLPLSIARTVLNCARADPRYAGHPLPPPQSGTYTGAFPVLSAPSEAPTYPESPPVAPRGFQGPSRPHRLSVVRHPSTEEDDEDAWRPAVRLRTTWKRRYGMARNARQRKVWHVLDPYRSEIRYWPTPSEPDRQWDPRIKWVCSGSSSMSNPVLLERPPFDMSMCRTCERMLEHPDYDIDVRRPLRDWWTHEGVRV